MMQMMSRMVKNFKEEENGKKKSFRRSSSATKVKQYYRTSTSQEKREQPKPHRNNSAKINFAKELHTQEEYINLIGKKAEQTLMSRPTTAHDLQNRTKVHQRTQTARSSLKTFKSKDSPTKSVVLSARKHSRVMSFNPMQEYEEEYRKKLKTFLDYLYKVNFSNGVFIEMNLLPVDIESNIKRYKIHVDKGNNSNLIK